MLVNVQKLSKFDQKSSKISHLFVGDSQNLFENKSQVAGK
jgi:hypothetical protein